MDCSHWEASQLAAMREMLERIKRDLSAQMTLLLSIERTLRDQLMRERALRSRRREGPDE
jgi:hypothetical protein